MSDFHHGHGHEHHVGHGITPENKIKNLEMQLAAASLLIMRKERKIKDLEEIIKRLIKKHSDERNTYASVIRNLEIKANVDEKTGVLRAVPFYEAVEAMRSTSKKDSQGVLMVLDIDRFKNINDTYGHAVGDLALQEFANNLRSITRESDVKGRIGGEEFAIFFPDETVEDIRLKFLTGEGEFATLKTTYKRPNKDGNEVEDTFSVSGGMVEVKKDDDIHERFKDADKLVYKAKSNSKPGENPKVGRNQILEESESN